MNKSGGDTIEKLPLDPETKVSQEDLMFIDTLFKNDKKMSKLFMNFKPTIIAVILFVIFSLSIVDDVIVKVVGDKSHIMNLLIKIAVFAVIFYVLSNNL